MADLFQDVSALWSAKRFYDAEQLLEREATPAEARRIRARLLMPIVDSDYDRGYSRGYHDAMADSEASKH